MSDDVYGQLLKPCLAIADEASEIVRKAWSKPRHVRHKGAIDLVTETDMAVQNFLAEKLRGLYPPAAFLGEEDSGAQSEKPDPGRDLCWIIDPVDGTTNFVHHIPTVAISIALWDKGQPRLGIVAAPILGETFYAVTGQGAACNGSKIHVSANSTLADALVGTGFPYEPLSELPSIINRLERVLPETQGIRRLGAAALDLAYVAAGRLDIFYETQLKAWDAAAGILLVREAGGIISDFMGRDFKFGEPLLADNSLLHAAILPLVAPLT